MTQEKQLPITRQRCKKPSEEISKIMGKPFSHCDFCSRFCEDCLHKEPDNPDTPTANMAEQEPVKACPHLHTFHTGGFHYNEDDVWDDIQYGDGEHSNDKMQALINSIGYVTILKVTSLELLEHLSLLDSTWIEPEKNLIVFTTIFCINGLEYDSMILPLCNRRSTFSIECN